MRWCLGRVGEDLQSQDVDGGLVHGYVVAEFGNAERRRKSGAVGAAAGVVIVVERG